MNKSCEYCGLLLPSNVFLAPMAGVTTRAFRTIARSFGCALAWTEMISAEGLVRKDPGTRAYLPGDDEGGPVVLQLFGHRPETLREATLIAQETPAAAIDINMGCPVRKVVKDGSGAALLREPRKIAKILAEVCKAARKPVTVKIRAGWDSGSRNAVEVARIARDCGVSAVTVHGRTARQGFSGKADWETVAEVVRAVDLPVIGSGDLLGPRDVAAVIARTGCAGVMIGRGAMGRPWLFSQIEKARQGTPCAEPAPGEIGLVMLRHLELNIEQFGVKKGVILSRRPLSWYSRACAEAAGFRRRVNTMTDQEELREEIARFTGAGAGR